MRSFPDDDSKGEDCMNRLLEDLRISVRVEQGPLGSYVGAYAAQLLSEGYARHSSCVKIRLVGAFNRWLNRKGIAANKVIDQHTVDFLRYHNRCGHRLGRGDPATLKRLLKLLRDQGVIAQRPAQIPTTPSERLVEEYDIYLQKERVLSLATRINYNPFVQKFLTVRFGKGPVRLSRLRATDIIGFVRCHAGQLHGKRVQLMTTALRSFLQFARLRGDITLDLAACVPAVASWSLSTLPRAIPPAHVKLVLEHCNRQTAIGRRDYAILLLLARLGLRSGEIAALSLEDIDWKNGVFSVVGKGGCSSQLPLPADVGNAIAAYLKDGRPRLSRSRRVFLRARAPAVGFTSMAVRDVVKRALDRAGIDSPRKGAHQFRHALATGMLNRGASLSEIGQLLRHQNPDTTRIYAKVDLVSLRALAMPWPGGEL
jgi:integrase/recombinase XerD